MSACKTLLVSSPVGEPATTLDSNGSSPALTSSPSPQTPAPVFRHRPRRVRGEGQRCSIPSPTASIASPPLPMMKRKLDFSPSAPLKRFRRNKNTAIFSREPYEAAVDRERAASVAAALERAFWESKMANAEEIELKIVDYQITMTGAKLANLPFFE